MNSASENHGVQEPNPLVSIIVPTYNSINYLPLALQSVEDQSFRDWELIVVDDCSPNNPELVCRAFPKAKLIRRNKNGGIAAARNSGLERARGKYIAFLDEDDLWHPRKLEMQVHVLEQTAAILCHTRNRIVGADGEFRDAPPSQLEDELPDQVYARRVSCENIYLLIDRDITTSSVVLDRAAIVAVGCFNESTKACEDIELWFRLSTRGTFAYIDYPLTYYRRHEENQHTSDYLAIYRWKRRLHEILSDLEAERPDLIPVVEGAIRRGRLLSGYHAFNMVRAAVRRKNWRAALFHLANAVWLEPKHVAENLTLSLKRIGKGKNSSAS